MDFAIEKTNTTPVTPTTRIPATQVTSSTPLEETYCHEVQTSLNSSLTSEVSLQLPGVVPSLNESIPGAPANKGATKKTKKRKANFTSDGKKFETSTLRKETYLSDTLSHRYALPFLIKVFN